MFAFIAFVLAVILGLSVLAAPVALWIMAKHSDRIRSLEEEVQELRRDLRDALKGPRSAAPAQVGQTVQPVAPAPHAPPPAIAPSVPVPATPALANPTDDHFAYDWQAPASHPGADVPAATPPVDAPPPPTAAQTPPPREVRAPVMVAPHWVGADSDASPPHREPESGSAPEAPGNPEASTQANPQTTASPLPDPSTIWEPPPALPPEPEYAHRPREVVRETPPGRGLFAALQENLFTVIAMLVILVGVGSLLTYAVREGWFTVPIELRLGAVAAAGLGAAVFGWRERLERRDFGLTLQGGGLGVVLMTVFAAFRFYDLFATSTALGLSLAIIVQMTILAVAQNAPLLAGLGTLAGFAAPLLISSDSGNHVGLFSLYAIINAAIMAITWYKPWKSLHLLGFLATFAVGLFWGVLDYAPEKLGTTLPFLVLFYLMYLAIPLLRARHTREDDPLEPGVRHTLIVFGNPLLSFAALSQMVDSEIALSGAAMALAVIHGVTAAAVWQLLGRELLGRFHAVVAIGALTLAIPLGFTAEASASLLALAAMALAWAGLRFKDSWAQAASVAVFAVAGVMCAVVERPDDLAPIANAATLSGILLALALGGTAALYRNHRFAGAYVLHFVAAMAVWTLTGLLELDTVLVKLWVQENIAFMGAAHPTGEFDAQLKSLALLHGFWVLAGLTTALLGGVYSLLQNRLSVVFMALWHVAALAQLLAHLPLAPDLFAHQGLWAGFAYALLGMAGMFGARSSQDLSTTVAHTAWLWTLTAGLANLLGHLAGEGLGFGPTAGWTAAGTLLPWALLIAGLAHAPQLVGYPFRAFASWRSYVLITTHVVVWAWVAAHHIWVAGSSAPLPWLPILNPLEFLLTAHFALFAWWLLNEARDNEDRPLAGLLLSAMLLVLLTTMTLRSVHHLDGVPWNLDILSVGSAQMALTIVYTVAGMIYWILGSQRGERMVWQTGAAIFLVTLAKVLLVDRQHLGDLAGIASFIGYGVLLLVVGYLAPVPKARPEGASPGKGDDVPGGDEPPARGEGGG